MSYPEPRYHGDAGEPTARLRRADTPPDVRYAHGGSVDYLATGASTDGLFGLYRWNMTAASGGPAPHFHRTIAESFFVLVGTVTIFDGHDWVDFGVGDFVHVPPGGIHGFRNDSGAAASMLLHFAPGAPREGYFEAFAEWAATGRPGDDEVAEFYRLHDNIWLP